jgi:hypothetical protein
MTKKEKRVDISCFEVLFVLFGKLDFSPVALIPLMQAQMEINVKVNCWLTARPRSQPLCPSHLFCLCMRTARPPPPSTPPQLFGVRNPFPPRTSLRRFLIEGSETLTRYRYPFSARVPSLTFPLPRHHLRELHSRCKFRIFLQYAPPPRGWSCENTLRLFSFPMKGYLHI